jgi:hypothetical protein
MFCWLHKLMVSHAQDGNCGLTGITKKHISHCQDCCRFYKTCQSLGESLTQEAAIVNGKTLRRLNKRLLSAISTRRVGAHHIKIKLWFTATAACFALFFLLGVWLLVAHRDGRNIAQSEQLQMADGIQELRIIYSHMGRDLPIIRQGVIERPLANEFKCLTSDTQSAVRFLVACVDVDMGNPENSSVN